MQQPDERRRAAPPPAALDEHDAAPDRATDEQQRASGGGERYQTAHRQHPVEREGRGASRAARGTGPDRGPSQTSTSEYRMGQSGNPATDAPGASPAEQSLGQVEAVSPHPDDEARLEEHGYPKLGGHIQSRTTQHEHGPNAGGSQQGDPASAQPGEPGDASHRH
jgi:hypothetical protein